MTSNRLTAWVLVIFFVISPVVGWSINHERDHKTKDVLTTAYLYKAIATYNKNGDNTPLEGLTIDSFSCTDTIWCVAKVHDTSATYGSMLFGSFFGDYSRIRVVTTPFDIAFQKNISGGIGVPYDVLNKLNGSFGVKQ